MDKWLEGKLLGRAEITGIIQLETGMHIGRSKDTLQIGGIDNPIIRDPFSGEPYIPGSSLKGKMRGFAEKVLISAGDSRYGFDSISNLGGGVTIYRHECPTAELAKDCPVCRLFGANGNQKVLDQYKGRGNPSPIGDDEFPTNFPARVTVSDAFLTTGEEGSVTKYKGLSDLPYAEWKSENTVDRITAAANPRQVERAAKGLEFEFHLTYTIKPDGRVVEDLQNLLFALWLVEQNGLGGQTSRGYGQIWLQDLSLHFSKYSLDKNVSPPKLKSEEVQELILSKLENLDLLEERLDEPVFQQKLINAYSKSTPVGEGESNGSDEA